MGPKMNSGGGGGGSKVSIDHRLRDRFPWCTYQSYAQSTATQKTDGSFFLQTVVSSTHWTEFSGVL
jgi:hypothetical protein